jgi:hypothetical protein
MSSIDLTSDNSSGFQLDLKIALSGASSEGPAPRAAQLGRRCVETSGDETTIYRCEPDKIEAALAVLAFQLKATGGGVPIFFL